MKKKTLSAKEKARWVAIQDFAEKLLDGMDLITSSQPELLSFIQAIKEYIRGFRDMEDPKEVREQKKKERHKS